MATTSPSAGARPASSASSAATAERQPLLIALAGTPNSGKTSLFNRLTGLRGKVANYPGVTVEKRTGRLELADGQMATVVDLPGTYSLSARSEDERVARNALLGLAAPLPRPDVAIVVLDAANLERGVFLATQVQETGVRVLVALTMPDLAARRGAPVDAARLEERLGVPVVVVNPRTGEHLPALLARVGEATRRERAVDLPAPVSRALDPIVEALAARPEVPPQARQGEALRLLLHARDGDPWLAAAGPDVQQAVAAGRAALVAAGLDREAVDAAARHAFARQTALAARPTEGRKPHFSERVDRLLLHRVLGPLLFIAIMGLIFQALFAWAEPAMGWIEEGVGFLQAAAGTWFGEGAFRDLVVDGVIAGVGNVLVFLPQIVLLFLFLALLEDVGYLARAAFLIDRVMRVVGLSGKSFVPLLSSFACAIPGIMATRSIENRRDRFVTILVAPFMSCAARLPVYALMIGAFLSEAWRAPTLLAMYLLSILAALVAAWVLRGTMFRGEAGTYIMELPAYRPPNVRTVVSLLYTKSRAFVVQAGTVILAFSIVLWALAYFPRSEDIKQEATARLEAGQEEGEVAAWAKSAQVEQSYMGRAGKAIEPAIEPLGFDWKIGVGLVASFAAREVIVPTLGIVYSVAEDPEEEPTPLRERLQQARRPDGTKAYNALVAISLMVFFVLACQCMSTLAVVKRETASWRWPIFMFVYMTAAAYLGSLIVYQGGKALGWGL